MTSTQTIATASITLGISLLLTACGGGDKMTQTAEHCFDDKKYQSGNSFLQEDHSPAFNRNYSITYNNYNSQSFNGHDNLIMHTRVSREILPSGQMSTSHVETETYLAPVSPLVYAEYGSNITSFSGSMPRLQQYTYSPPVIDRSATLEPGQTQRLEVTGTLRMLPPGTIAPHTLTRNSSYLEDATLTIGNRTVTACKFKTGSGSSTGYEWIYKGFTIQSSGDGTNIDMVTTKLTRNGQDY
ncbi:Uncharacterised protein [Delftia tsuruhatensis]|uniref:hypothetical protein n=1 Tax=Delftia tsuruhatensis TaxID=180282 RepID=UPI001E6DD5E2|nr:hypothetical protein [Delftia tsuruhatensis]CAB5658033.1 Uncharacterised protein [Delftia tsuruhatensis]CAC9679338.1 Uncharacterised protein [Delftia tsuruhatensis]